MLKTIVYDMDGIIIDSESLYDIEQGEFFATRGMVYDRETVKPLVMGKGPKEATQILLDIVGSEENVDVVIQQRRKRIQELYETKLTFIPGFEAFDNWAGQQGLTRVIATGSIGRILEAIDNKLQLQRLFHGNIITSDMVGNKGKPAPDIFLAAAEKMGVQPSECIVIEDATNGVSAAHAAGMPVVAMTTTLTKEQLSSARPT